MFWTDYDSSNVQRMCLATNNIETLATSKPGGIRPDYTNKRVYWIERGWNKVMHIFSSDYNFQHKKNIRNGSFSVYMLAIAGDLLYFNDYNVPYINQMNLSNGKTVRSILFDVPDKFDLIVVHSSLQPMGM